MSAAVAPRAPATGAMATLATTMPAVVAQRSSDDGPDRSVSGGQPPPAAASLPGRPVPGAAFLALGALFGVLLSRAGATHYDAYAGLFLFRDLQLLWVIAVGAATGAVAIAALQRARARVLLTGEPLAPVRKPMRRGLFAGAVLLGLGWGLAGACPGTVLVMVGEGKVQALWTVAGIGLGTWLYGLVEARRVPAPTVGTAPAAAPQ